MRVWIRLWVMVCLAWHAGWALAWGGAAPLDVARQPGQGEQVQLDMLQVDRPLPMSGPLVLPASDAHWKTARPGLRALGFPRNGMWMRATLSNSASQPILRWLVVGEPFLDQIDCQVRDTAGRVQTYRTGDQRPFGTRPEPFPKVILPIDVPARGTATVHCYARNNGSLTVVYEVWEPQAYTAKERRQAVARAACYGALIFVIVCGVLLAVILRTPLSMLLIVEEFPVLMATSMREGDAFAWLWPNWPVLNMPPFTWILIGMMAAAQVFRKLVALSPGEDRLVKGVVALCGALLIPALGFGLVAVQLSELVQYLSVVIPLIMIAIAVRHWSEGALPRILAVGMTAQYVGLLFNAAGVLGYAGPGFELSSLYASVLKAVALSSALAFRMKLDRIERDRAQSNHMLELEQRVAYEAELRHAVSHHPRYGMPNQSLLEEALRTCLPSVPPPGVAVWVVRMNRFGFLESILPRDTLTGLVKAQASEISRWFAARHDVALLAIDGEHRVAALDESTLCFLSFGQPSAALQSGLSSFLTRRFEHEGLFVAWDPHIGVAMIAPNDTRTSGLTEEARVALQWCNPHQRLALFDAVRMKREQLAYGLTLDLEGAIERGELVLHYQPKVKLPSRRTVSLEALVRWRHPERGMIPPGAFIAEAEATGAINRLTMWAIREAARFVLTLPDPTVKVSVNISAFDLATPHFVQDVLAILTQEHCAPYRLILEVTESAALSDRERATEILSALRDHGVQIALDDFGTGYSSLAILQEMPLDEMKVDRSFVTDIAGVERKQAVLKAMIEVGHRLGLMVTIEGVEIEDSVAWLEQHGCDVVQGFVFSRPLEAAIARDWVARFGPQPSAVPAQAVSAVALGV